MRYDCRAEHGSHETSAEANACLRAWISDPSSVDLMWIYGFERPCMECSEPTTRGARVRGLRRSKTVPLCDEHLTQQIAVKFVDLPAAA